MQYLLSHFSESHEFGVALFKLCIFLGQNCFSLACCLNQAAQFFLQVFFLQIWNPQFLIIKLLLWLKLISKWSNRRSPVFNFFFIVFNLGLKILLVIENTLYAVSLILLLLQIFIYIFFYLFDFDTWIILQVLFLQFSHCIFQHFLHLLHLVLCFSFFLHDQSLTPKAFFLSSLLGFLSDSKNFVDFKSQKTVLLSQILLSPLVL